MLAAAGGLPVSHMDKGFAEEFGQVLDMLRKVGECRVGGAGSRSRGDSGAWREAAAGLPT